MNSEQLKATIASYWRYVKQCPVVALEVSSTLSSYSDGERADILAVDKGRFLIETEIKVSLGDLRKDRKKRKHRAFRDNSTGCVTHHFYFAVPRDIANDTKLICDDLFPYAGILASDGGNELGVMVYRNPKPLSGKRLSFPQALRIAYGQSATVCRLANKVSELTRVLERKDQQLKVYKDWERLQG